MLVRSVFSPPLRFGSGGSAACTINSLACVFCVPSLLAVPPQLMARLKYRGQDRFRGIVARGRAGLASELRRGVVEHGPHQLGLLGVKDCLDLDHAVLGVAATDVAALRVVIGAPVLAMTLHERVLAT